MSIIRVEVLTRTPTEFFHCGHCEVVFQQVGLGQHFRAEQRAVGLPADLQAEFDALASWVADLVERFGSRIQIDVVDVASLEGFFKTLRYRVWRYPSIVVDGEVVYRPGQAKDNEQHRVAAFDVFALEEATETIARRLAA